MRVTGAGLTIDALFEPVSKGGLGWRSTRRLGTHLSYEVGGELVYGSLGVDAYSHRCLRVEI